MFLTKIKRKGDMLLINTKLDKSQVCDGNGVFSMDFIPKDKCVWDYNPRIDWSLNLTRFNRLKEKCKKWYSENYFYFYYDKHLDKYIYCKDNGKYMNHSDYPNIVIVDNKDYALRDINKGEELTVDYYQMTSVEFIKSNYSGI